MSVDGAWQNNPEAISGLILGILDSLRNPEFQRPRRDPMEWGGIDFRKNDVTSVDGAWQNYPEADFGINSGDSGFLTESGISTSATSFYEVTALRYLWL